MKKKLVLEKRRLRKKQQGLEEAMRKMAKVYVSGLVDKVKKNMSLPEKLRIFDTTLRDGEQTPGVSLSFKEKTEIALKLDELGVDTIEAGFPISSKGEQQSFKELSKLGLKAELCGLARTIKEDIDTAIDCNVDCVHTFIGTSPLHLKYKLKITPQECLEKAVWAVDYIKSRGATCEFSCEDATRTKLEFLKKVYSAVEQAGADRHNVPDTVGVMVPASMKHVIEEIKKVVKKPISMHCHNDFGLAVANTLAGIEAGAEQAQVTINGLGERAGNADLEQTVASAQCFYGIKSNIRLNKLYETSKLVQKYTGIVLTPNYPLVGLNAFSHEAGIHVHGVISKAATYEPISPELVGNQRRFVVGKHTGKHAINHVLSHLGYQVSKESLEKIVERVKELGDKRKRITEEDLSAIADGVLGELPEKQQTIKIQDLAVITGKNICPTASVTLNFKGEELKGAAIGVGPVDAAANAINTVVNLPNLKLKEYNLSAITGGTEALADVKIIMEDDKKREYSGDATHEDIVMASVNALVKCLNRAMGTGGKKKR